MADWQVITDKMGIAADTINTYPFRGASSSGGVNTTAGGAISQYRLVELSGSTVVEATEKTARMLGSAPADTASGEEILPQIGAFRCISAGKITAGERIRVAADGRVIGFLDPTAAATSLAVDDGVAFTNQPTNDGVEILSDSASDVGTVTVIGFTTGGVVMVVETITLTGTTFVPTVKTDWGSVVAIKADAHVGTITVREASADAAIVTLATGTNSAGVVSVAESAYGAAPDVVGDGASTKVVAVKYLNAALADAYMAVALNGTTEAALPTAANYIYEMYVGDVAASTEVTLTTNATADTVYEEICGRALESVATTGLPIFCNLY